MKLSHNLQLASPRAATPPDPATASADASAAFAVAMPPARPTTMDDSYDRKRYAHLDNKTMDNSYSHLRAAGASANHPPALRANAPQTPLRRHRHVDEGAVLAEMSTAAPPFPHKALDAAVVAHCGRDRLGSGAAWADHCAFRGVDISPVVRADEGAADEKHRYYARYSAGVVEPLHVNSKADLEWVVLSGKFKVEAGPVNPVPGHPKVADTLVAGSWWAVPRGQPHEVTCLEAGVVFVSYNGSPIMKSLKHAAIDA